MPLFNQINLSPVTELYLWKITEDLSDLYDAAILNEVSHLRLDAMKSEAHKKGFIAVRMLLQYIGYNDFDLYYDSNGKPHLKDGKQISISHSGEFSAIVISEQEVGLDLERLKSKILKIAFRYMEVSHLEGLNEIEQIKKATVIWGIKESIFKIKNEQGISFLDHIFEAPFIFDDKQAIATLVCNNQTEKFSIQFNLIEDYIFVCAFQLH
ncbi:4'-phosphopantetheinyl transferase superfamily protein [Flavobacterium sp. SUN046]|uniref:4'-phosphopantetheinyl transferase family protein n=1 Tax=Flavobacterium sp. SUN046 TaxID=3002440 RepID=UPI002DB9B04E|nr:4'-phosphopantetheinyl transferase superfamily protein [Flavobacterium sp. SUN046]MEC4049999.1 4'-phosphopantetheinyl transferase superfamily protein [Flavobacterium sp. SUN046]